MHTRSTLVTASFLVFAACGDKSNPVDPPTTGSLTINVETVGALPDPDGYRVTRAGAEALALPVNGSVRVDSLAPGAYTFALDKASLYCAVDEGPTRNVQVTAGASASITFRVRCEPNGLMFVTGPTSAASLRIVFPGREPVTLVTGTGLLRPRFSPDRRRIAYSMVFDGTAVIRYIDLDSLGITQVSPPGAPHRTQPAWSPDGTRMAYSASGRIRTVRLGETQEATVYEAPAGVSRIANSPVWSPDGSLIAFNRSGFDAPSPQVVVTNPDGSGERVLTHFYNIGLMPIDWSPDGKSILYPYIGGIGIVDVATGETRIVVTSDLQYLNPVFLPDGRIGFYAATLSGTPAGNWIIRADGTGLTRVEVPGFASGAHTVVWQ